jgi:hypothetical protein
MMFKKQLAIVQKDCNGMLMDLYQTIPVIKEEKLLGDAIAMRNLCKADKSSKTLKENYLKYEGFQRKIICKLTISTEKQNSEEPHATMMEEPTSSEQVAAMAMKETDRAVVIATLNGQEEHLLEFKIRQPINKNNDLSCLQSGSTGGNSLILSSDAKLDLVSASCDE